VTFTTSFTVQWSDLDANGHMKSSRYSEYATECRLAFLAAGGVPPERFAELRFGPVIFREEVLFRRELRLGHPFEVDLHVVHVSDDDRKFTITHTLRAEGQVAASVEVDGAWMNLVTRRIAAPPADVAAALRRGK
jgi:acyl-CoA thioester hydrolase